ncbi:hypothetical protein L1987_15198 [Smallanthus sonchifolius]|uniref:Uncharacterized protein n=1 Tax=Smallanthus sonchifolius TaxID=185202 RepID=A0ACB9J5A4_9ASTR|nr:hypothetical protein L1987_15198 [Smallanthus sonchifolius]
MLTNLKKQRRTLTLCVIYRDSSDDDFQKPLKQLKKSSDKKLKSASVVGISAKGLVPYDEEKTIRIRNSPITLCKLERYKRTNPGKKQIPAISFFENDTINKLSADDEEKEKEKEKEVEIETVKGDRKRKRGDKEEKEQVKEKEKEMETKTVKGDRKRKGDMIKSKTKALDTYMSETHELIVEGYGKYKSEEIFDAIDEWRFRLKHYGDKYNKELNEDKAAQAEKGENEEKRTQSQKMMVSLFDTTQFRFSDSILEDVITEVKKHKEEEKMEKRKRRKEMRRNQHKKRKKKNPKGLSRKLQTRGQKPAKTSNSKPSVPASTGSVLPGLQTAGKDEKPAKEKGREGNKDKPAQVKKVKEVDAGERKVNEQKVVEDNVGKAGGFETPAPKSKDDSEVPVFIGVNLNKKNKEQKKNVACATRPAEALCSPYVQRVVQLNTKRENIEDRIAEWIFASIEDPWIFVFQNATSIVLNNEEIYRSRGALARFFCPCNMLVCFQIYLLG